MSRTRETLGLPSNNGYIARVIMGLGFTILPVVIFLAIFLFATPSNLKKVVVLLALLIPWFLALMLTVIFLSRRYNARVQRVLSGEYWTLWQYESGQTTQRSDQQDMTEQVYLGPLGICWAGKNPVLIDFGDELTDVGVIEQDRKTSALQFKYRAKRYSLVGFSTRSIFDYVVSFANLGSPGMGYVLNVPIPKEHEAEAEELVERFRLKLQGLPFGSSVERRLGLSVHFASAILYGVVAMIVTTPPLSIVK